MSKDVYVTFDPAKDVLLSNNLNCPFIGVLTGNHSAEKLIKKKIGKSQIINSVRELTIGLIYSLF